jgi:hypothetical protein
MVGMSEDTKENFALAAAIFLFALILLFYRWLAIRFPGFDPFYP